MRLITFQPLNILSLLVEDRQTYIPEKNKTLNKPVVFCLKVDENTMRTIFYTAPSMPQTMLVLEVPDEEILDYDYVKWINLICKQPEVETTGKYKEYHINRIEPDWVVRTRVITDSDDPDEVQDEFMNAHFRFLEKLSGYNWYRSNDEEIIKNFWRKNNIAHQYVAKVTHIMSPMHRSVTEEDIDEIISITENIFIKQ